MRSRLDTLIAPGALAVVFQPILELRRGVRRVHALEGLVRGPAGTHFEAPTVLFEYVRRKRAEPAADLACLRAVVAAGAGLPEDTCFALNVHAATLDREPEFLAWLSDLLSAHAIEPERVTIELVEYAPEWATRGLAEAIAALRHIGVGLALDDVGLGHSNFKTLLDTRPDYIKIDRYFVSGAHADPYRAAVLEASVLLARRFGARMIAEGVETCADLEIVRDLGIELVQGYLFMPAVPAPDVAGALAGCLSA